MLRQIGEALYGQSWQTDLAGQISVSDRSMRRWASGQDAIPLGVWRDIHYHAESRWLRIQYFDREIEKRLQERKLQPIPNTRPLPDLWGLYFSMATDRGRPVRCMIRRDVLDDRVDFKRMQAVFDYFSRYADVFYRVAQRKFELSALDGDLVSIGNDDVAGEDLPDVRSG
ncbi:hypothetical protein GGD66_006980 [Bradyrhizobium sp. CIR48]|uniref:hypothetical protein n=1 Tax=Bradyrhizobium sp. CIR48 TaxID=2663840 RepID=UPI00160610BF|nr:hypothetical protein [Bradyrhizobium sp. CIR48]MBB4428393.1 hypothetical protein [Bradyrhizobium sp. CIR48]